MLTVCNACGQIKGGSGQPGNPLEGLTRAEWLESLLRCAKAKAGRDCPPGQAVRELVALMRARLEAAAAASQSPHLARDARDAWRRAEFYTAAADAVYRAWEPKLEALFRSKLSSDVAVAKAWRLADWRGLLERARFFEDESFTRAEGNLCFYYAIFEVVDYRKDRNRYEVFAAATCRRRSVGLTLPIVNRAVS
jgi:hypothetical protein